jgi:hypothetical protein
LLEELDFVASGRISGFVRAPGDGGNSRGPLLPQRFSPDPR